MATTFDSQSSAKGTNATSLSIPAFTVGSGANRLVVAHYLGWADTVGVTAALGADPTMSVIAGTDGTTNSATVSLYRITTLTGSQTASMSCTNAQANLIGGVITFIGADQSTAPNNGNWIANNPSNTITSGNGDLTTTGGAAIAGGTVQAGAGDTGPGTGTTTHTWTGAVNDLTTNQTRRFFQENGSSASVMGVYGISGANVVQVAATGPDPGIHFAGPIVGNMR